MQRCIGKVIRWPGGVPTPCARVKKDFHGTTAIFWGWRGLATHGHRAGNNPN